MFLYPPRARGSSSQGDEVDPGHAPGAAEPQRRPLEPSDLAPSDRFDRCAEGGTAAGPDLDDHQLLVGRRGSRHDVELDTVDADVASKDRPAKGLEVVDGGRLSRSADAAARSGRWSFMGRHATIVPASA